MEGGKTSVDREKKKGRRESEIQAHLNAERDGQENVEHAIIECEKWARMREECEVELGKRVNADNMMPKNEEGWMVIERNARDNNKNEMRV